MRRSRSLAKCPQQSILPTAQATTAYNTDNQLTTWGAATLTYDDNGNLTSDGTNSLTWDARNRLTALGSVATFVTDGVDRRQSITKERDDGHQRL